MNVCFVFFVSGVDFEPSPWYKKANENDIQNGIVEIIEFLLKKITNVYPLSIIDPSMFFLLKFRYLFSFALFKISHKN